VRIAKVTNSFFPAFGGTEIVIHNLAQQLTARGHEITVYVPYGSVKRFRELNIAVPYAVRHLLPFSLSYFWRKRKLVPDFGKYFIQAEQRKRAFDLWHAYSAFPIGNLIGRSLKGRVPIILRCHGGDIQTLKAINYGVRLNPSIDLIVRQTVPMYDLLIANSQSMEEEYIAVGANKERIRVIPNAVDIGRFQAGFHRDRIRKMFGLPLDKRIILTTGRNHPKKGYQFIPEIARHLLKKRQDFLWLVVGKKAIDLLPALRQRGLSQYVLTWEEIVGNRQISGESPFLDFPTQRLINLYRCADCFCLPTYIESFGSVFVEAMAAGLPIVTTDVAGCRDVVENGKTGFLCPFGNWTDMAELLNHLLSDAALHERMAHHGVETCKNVYNWVRSTNLLENSYHSLLYGKDVLKPGS